MKGSKSLPLPINAALYIASSLVAIYNSFPRCATVFEKSMIHESSPSLVPVSREGTCDQD
jgi:hypothetical protein